MAGYLSDVWVANYSSNSVQKIVNGVAQTAITVGTNPYGSCVDKDNNVWVANNGSNSVQKIVNGVAQTAITVGTNPYNIGDATGMQAAMLFGWDSIMSNFHQAMTGGM